MSISAIIMLILSIILFLIIAVSALIGIFRGIKRCLWELIRTVLAAVLAFATVSIFCMTIPAGEIFVKLIEPLTGKIDIISDSPALQMFGGTLAYSFAVPIVFTLLFVIYDLILLIPMYPIGRLCGFIKKKPKRGEDKPHISILSRLFGMTVKAVNSFIVIIIVLIPISGWVYTFSDGFMQLTDTAKAQAIELDTQMSEQNILGYTLINSDGMVDFDEVDRFSDDLISPVKSNVFLLISSSTPIRYMCNAMTHTEDSSGLARSEVSQLFDFAGNALYFIQDPKSYGDAQEKAIAEIIGYVADSELHSSVAAELISNVASNVKETNKVFGVDMSKFTEGDISMISIPMLEVLSETTTETVKLDLETLRDVLVVTIDHKIVGAFADFIETKNEKDLIRSMASEQFIYEMIVKLYGNNNFRKLTVPTVNYLFTVVIKSFDSESERLDAAKMNENCSDEELHREAKIFSDMLNDADKLIDMAPTLTQSEDSLSAIASADMATIGRFLNNARRSELIGGGVNKLIITLLGTKPFDSMRSIADILIKNIEEDKNGELDFEQLFSSVQQFVSIMQEYESNGASDPQVLANALRTLNKSCTGKVGEVLKEIIEDKSVLNSALLSSGDEAKNESAQKIVTVMIDKLTSGEMSDEQFEKEAKAIDYTLKLVQATNKDELQDICGDDESRATMIETIASSEIASSAILELAYEDGDTSKPLTDDAMKLKENIKEEDIGKVKEECKEYYIKQLTEAPAESESTKQIEDNLKAISGIFGQEITDAELAAWRTESIRQ